jgi:D-arabinose 1-dehydrogenase-like Zn-dependent alcohol dehydrogenase
MNLPETYKALVVSSFKEPIDLTLKSLPIPTLTAGSAIVQILATRVNKTATELYSGKRGFPMSMPFVPGTGAIVRVAAVGPDAVTLAPGQLALFAHTVHARDDPTLTFLQGLFAFGPAKKLMDGEWRNGTYAEYAKVPLENIHPLNEDLLINRMGYSVQDLTYIDPLCIPYGGFADIELKPGETVVVAPATGSFGGAAVTVALGMGARVIAAGRNDAKLTMMLKVLGPLYGDRLSTVQLTGDVEVDTKAIQSASPDGKGADCFMDFAPPEASKSTHIKACLLALKPNGRASIMGGIRADVSIPLFMVVMRNLQIKGKLMYRREDVTRFIGMVEAGLIKLGSKGAVKIGGSYKLEEAMTAFEIASQNTGYGVEFAFTP